MRLSKYFIPTLKEDPSDATAISHKLMFRAGLIRKLSAGIYSYLPFGLKAFKNVEKIIREEMNRSGALEFSLPITTPKELWEASGRWSKYGPELFRITDRQDHQFVFGPTHEEVFTDIVKNEINSYRQLPVNFYQIKSKFRDEIRPRYGVMRAKEFMMKDAYSFDETPEGLEKSYKTMRDTYIRIFKRCGLKIAVVEADTGAMGGSDSEEFMVESDVGEATIAKCDSCGYAANIERAKAAPVSVQSKAKAVPLEIIDTPGQKTIEELMKFLKTSDDNFIKSLIYIADKAPVMILCRGMIEINEIKLKNFLSVVELVLADEATIEKLTGGPVGFSGPAGLKDIKIFADESIKGISNGITGANKKDKHYINVNIDRDFKVNGFADLRLVKDKDLCVNCKGSLRLSRGIEVGHIFKLGYKYTESMNVNYLDRDGKLKKPIMGCYGIGLDRTLAAVIEQNNDEHGIIWPFAVAPFKVIIVPVDYSKELEKNAADDIYDKLENEGVEVLLDDRDERAGVKFNDADLSGIPLRITVGTRNLKNGKVELKYRDEEKVELFDIAGIVEKCKEVITESANTFQVNS